MKMQDDLSIKKEKANKKILYCASTLSHIKNFHIPYLKAFKDMGWEVHVAVEREGEVEYADKVIELPFCKSFFSKQNLVAAWKGRELLKKENYSALSTHTTLASVIMRTAALFLKKRPAVFNTVHGYLFSEGMGIKKYAYLLPEILCGRITDVVMVMNVEDFYIAKEYRLYREKLYYIDGMGVDFTKYSPGTKEEKLRDRQEMGFKDDDMLFVYAGEFSKRKNQSSLIKAFAGISMKAPYAHLLLAGNGALLEDCKELSETLNLEKKVHFMGYVTDMKGLYNICDVGVSSSFSEGLPFNIMEAMGCGLPIVASDIKGHRELVENGSNGLLYDVKSQEGLEKKLLEMYRNSDMRMRFSKNGLNKIGKFSIGKVAPEIMGIYRNSLKVN